MLELEEALERILGILPEPKKETLQLEAAYGRFLAEEVLAGTDLPHFDNSAMDGYAVRAADTVGATPSTPVRLRQVGRVPAGSSFAGNVTAGEAVRIFTGSPIPAGADAVVMQEETRLQSGQPDAVLVTAEIGPGENIRRRGEDVAKGNVVLKAGTELTASRLALLGALGQKFVVVGRRPIVGVLATGSELRELGQELAPGEIYESNRLALAILIRQTGSEARVFPLVVDALSETRAALEKAFETCDMLVTSGGVSVGEMDFVKRAFEENAGTLEFWKVSIRPGRPFAFGRRGRKLLFGLPGNPVSAFVTFLLLVRPALLKWQGATDTALRCSLGVLEGEISNQGTRRHFVRVKVDAEAKVFSAGFQASHVLSSLGAANGLVDMRPGMKLQKGAVVKVLQWQ